MSKQFKVVLVHMFNGKATGGETVKFVATAKGLHRVVTDFCGRGWGCNVYTSAEFRARCGGYLTAFGDLVIPLPDAPPSAGMLVYDLAERR